ncbi:MAG TPA: PQQ-dependent sugar dehydrogenase, partial [Chitinophagaceae bacterium]|nr:PQQ-dependent sugar dehydrogenase [Chitinophagaceae bacterium]
MQYKKLSLIAFSSLLLISVTETGCGSGDQTSSTSDSATAVTTVSKVEGHYTTHCASCHGEKMIAFTDRDWKHGKTDSALLVSINHSWADSLPKFDSVLTAQDKQELVAYIQTGITNAARYIQKEEPTSNVFKTDSMTVKLDTVVSGLNVPWSIAFLPDGGMLVTERGGKLYLVQQGKDKQEIKGVPAVVAEGQGGLFDVKADPGFETNRTVYLSFAKGVKSDSGIVTTTAVVSASFDGSTLKNVKEIFVAQPYQKTRHHYGGRLEFGKDGSLFVTVGDRGKEFITAQSLQNDAGKVHRIKTDGTVPSDNPYVNTAGNKPTIYSYGHRNPQGMAIHPATGAIWENEHGPRGGDEINIVQQTKNYGWPISTWGINYDGKVISKQGAQEGMEQAVQVWIPSIGPSGMAFVQGEKYKGWANTVLSGSLRFRFLNISYLEGNKVVREEAVLRNIGRVRDVRMGPDGFVYVAVEMPGYVFRLVPAN